MRLTLPMKAAHDLAAILRRVVEGKARAGEVRTLAAKALAGITWATEDQSARKEPDGTEAPSEYQVPLPIILMAPARGPVRANDQFYCEHFDCALLVQRCLERQAAKWPGGNRMADGSVKEKRAGVHPYCSSELCKQGKKMAARCEYDPAAWWSKGRYRFYRPDSAEQRKKMRAARQEQGQEAADAPASPLQEAAMLTPDDSLT